MKETNVYVINVIYKFILFSQGYSHCYICGIDFSLSIIKEMNYKGKMLIYILF